MTYKKLILLMVFAIFILQFVSSEVPVVTIHEQDNIEMQGHNINNATNVSAGWFSGAFSWLWDTISSPFATFNGTTAGLTTNVTSWLYNQTYTGGTYNETYAPWAYNQTQSAYFYNQTQSAYFYNMSESLGGYLATYFMPLNTTPVGSFDFNGGWTANGFSIIGGDIFAQTGYFYNITGLNVNTLNINGSLIPQFDNTFDVGTALLQYKNGYFGTDVVISGIGVKQWLYNQTASAYFYNQTQSAYFYNMTLSSYYYNMTRNVLDVLNVSGQTLLAMSSGNVGIGTNAPVDKLQVHSSVGGNITISGGAGNPIDAGNLIFSEDETKTAGGFVIKHDGSNNKLYINELGTNDNYLTIDRVNNNIGIGTASPTHKLNVVGNANVTGELLIGNIGTAINISNTGKVAIGTSAPSNLRTFEVYGRDPYTDGAGFLRLFDTRYQEADVGPAIEFAGYLDKGASNEMTWATIRGAKGNNGTTGRQGELIFDVRDDAVYFREGMRIDGALDEIVFNNDGVDWNFRVESSGQPNALFIDGSNSKVGLGTAVPSAKLDINGSAIIEDKNGAIANLSGGMGLTNRLVSSNATTCTASDGVSKICHEYLFIASQARNTFVVNATYDIDARGSGQPTIRALMGTSALVNSSTSSDDVVMSLGTCYKTFTTSSGNTGAIYCSLWCPLCQEGSTYYIKLVAQTDAVDDDASFTSIKIYST